jgi:hypothetical protein
MVTGSLLGATRNFAGCELVLHRVSITEERALKRGLRLDNWLGLSYEERKMGRKGFNKAGGCL